jgi:hypothetical protein
VCIASSPQSQLPLQLQQLARTATYTIRPLRLSTNSVLVADDDAHTISRGHLLGNAASRASEIPRKYRQSNTNNQPNKGTTSNKQPKKRMTSNKTMIWSSQSRLRSPYFRFDGSFLVDGSTRSRHRCNQIRPTVHRTTRIVVARTCSCATQPNQKQRAMVSREAADALRNDASSWTLLLRPCPSLDAIYS